MGSQTVEHSWEANTFTFTVQSSLMSYRKTQVSWKLSLPAWSLKWLKVRITSPLCWPEGLEVDQPWVKCLRRWILTLKAGTWLPRQHLPKCVLSNISFMKCYVKESLQDQEWLKRNTEFITFWKLSLLQNFFLETMCVSICVIPTGSSSSSLLIYPNACISYFPLDSSFCTHHILPWFHYLISDESLFTCPPRLWLSCI